jgi:hypothetical protein
MGGVDVECDTIEELRRAAAGLKNYEEGASYGGQRTFKAETRERQGSGTKKSWEEAAEYAQKHGITRMEARSILSRQRKEEWEQFNAKKKRGRPKKEAT